MRAITPPRDHIDLVTDLEKRVRRLELTKDLSAGGGATEPVENAQRLGPYLNTGWTAQGAGNPMDALFYKDRERVYFDGIITYQTFPVGHDNSKPVVALPVAYRPDSIRNVSVPADPDNTSSTTARKSFWIAEVLTNGDIVLDQHADLGWPPDSTTLVLNFSYRLTQTA